MASIQWQIRADWNKDGVYEDDITARVSAVTPGLDISRGIDPTGAYQISEILLGLQNDDGKYSVENSASAYYGQLEPGVGIQIKATRVGGSTYNIWTGYVQRWENPNLFAGRIYTAELRARDILEYLNTYQALNVTSSTTRTTDAALTAIFSALGLSAGLYSLDAGQQTLALHFARGQNALAACMDVVRSEMGGYLWVRGDGVIRFESRAKRKGGYGSAVQWGDGTNIKPMRATYILDNQEAVTIVTVRAAVFLANQDTVEILRFSRNKDNRPADSLALTAGQTYSTRINYDAPVLVLASPVAQQDYLANTAQDGSGTDKTAQLAVTVTDLGGGCDLKLVNNDAGTIYVTEFRLRGTTVGFAADKPQFVSAKSVAGQVTDRTVNIDLPFADDTALKAADLSMQLLRTHRYRVHRLELEFQLERHNDIADSILAREIGDLVRYTDTSLGAKGLSLDEWYYVEGKHITAHPARPSDDRAVMTLIQAHAYRNLDAIVYDLFTRANAATLGAALKGGTWNLATQFAIVSNQAKPSNGATQTPWLELSSADCVVEVSLGAMNGLIWAGVVYRLADASNYWRAYLDYTNAKVLLEKVVAGVVTTVAQPAWTATATAELRVIVQGNRHRVWVDRKLYIDQTDAALNTNTKVGLYASNTTTTTYDDFVASGL